MRVRLTKRHDKGTQVTYPEDRTGALPETVVLLRYRRGVTEYEPATSLKGSGIRIGGRMVYQRDNGNVMRTTTIEQDPIWQEVRGVVVGCEIVTVNSRYVLEVCRSTETPTDPRGRRR